MNSLTLLIKPASSLCNMRCRYCFYEDESENRAQKSMGIMDAPVMTALIEKSMAYIGENGSLSVLFQGGEPTLAGAAFYADFTEKAARLLPKGASVHYAVQTNGLHISEEMLAVWKRHRFLVGVSMDGCRTLHNENRLDPMGEGTWQRIVKNLLRLQEIGLETNALCVITEHGARNGQKIYRTLKQLGLRYHQYIPCLDPLDAERGSLPFSLSPESYGNFLRETFDLWYADWKRGDYVSVRTFEDYVFNAMGAACVNCAVSGKCGQYLVIEADGSAYPCDFYALDDWSLGNIRENSVVELLNGETAEKFSQRRAVCPEECPTCPYAQICRSGCCRDWAYADGAPHNHYCKSFRMFFDHAMPRLREIAQAEMQSRTR